MNTQHSPLSSSVSLFSSPSFQGVDVIGYGGGNTGSLLRALERASVSYRLVQGTVDNTWPSGEAPLILPGVGAFGSLVRALEQRGLDVPIKEIAEQALVPFLGVCVGLQVLFESSEENPGVPGLCILPGQVVRFTGKKVPQIGWNGVVTKQPGWPEGYAYYVNSYYARPSDASCSLYESRYEAETFCGAVHVGNITAFQFHPEKSGEFGQRLLRYWLQTCAGFELDGVHTCSGSPNA
jgi:imidazole glycerol phosphate synthase glutamine amidotransferase subunit